MNRTPLTYLGILLVVIVLSTTIVQSQWDLTLLEEKIENHAALGAVIYVLYLIASVVFFPLSSLPLLAIATRVFGVWMTAILSITGWWIGCLIAFQVSRMGRHVLEHFMTLKKIDEMEARIPPNLGFVGIIILRMTLPVDITSYALGLLKHLKFPVYALASLLGIIPFAILWSIAGGRLMNGDWIMACVTFLLMVCAVTAIRIMWEKNNEKNPR